MKRQGQNIVSGSVTPSTNGGRRADVQRQLAVNTRSEDLAPWRAMSPTSQGQLLDWFLSADLSTDVDYQMICALTGRRKPQEWDTEADIRAKLLTALEQFGVYRQDILSRPARRRRVMPTGTETGRYGTQRFRSRARLVAHFRQIQQMLARIQERFVKASESTRHDDRLRSSLSLGALAEMLGDVRYDFAREDDIEWPRSFGPRPLRRMPLAVESSSMSLTGELALALAQRLAGAKKVGRCVMCGRAWIATDGRSRRVLCGSSECARLRRTQRRKPEPPEQVNARVSRWRKAERESRERELAPG